MKRKTPDPASPAPPSRARKKPAPAAPPAPLAEPSATEPSATDPRAALRAAIDAVSWARFQDAYGPADPVGPMLHAMSSDEPTVRERAFAQAYGRIHHPGGVYSASAPATAILARMLAVPDPRDPVALLRLLAHLAAIDPRDRSLGQPPPFARATKTARRDPEQRPFIETWEAACAAAPVARARLLDEDRAVRVHAAFLLGFLTPEAADSQRVLRARAAVETDPGVRAALAIADALLTRAGGRSEPPPASVGDLHLDAVISALAQGPATDAATLASLRDAAERGEARPASDLPWFDGDLPAWARRIEQSLGLRSTAELLAELAATPRADRKLFSERRGFLLRRVMGPSFAKIMAKRLPSELDEPSRALVNVLVALAGPEPREWPGLEGWGLFRTTRSMRRWAGLDPRGPSDHAVDGVPLWKLLSDRIHGHIPADVLARALARADLHARLGAWDEALPSQGFSPYELEVPGAHADEPPAYELALAQRHHDRFIDVLAVLALSCGPEGVARAEALLDAERALIAADKHPSGVRCALGLTVLTRDALGRGGHLDPAWDPMLAQVARAPGSQRAPRRARELFEHLPVERAEKILHASVELVSFAMNRLTVRGVTQTWRTIRCDDFALDLFAGLARPSPLLVEKVVSAVVAWFAVRDETPRGQTPPAPLPVDAIVRYLRGAGDAARPAIDAARGGPADAVWALLDAR